MRVWGYARRLAGGHGYALDDDGQAATRGFGMWALQMRMHGLVAHGGIDEASSIDMYSFWSHGGVAARPLGAIS